MRILALAAGLAAGIGAGLAGSVVLDARRGRPAGGARRPMAGNSLDWTNPDNAPPAFECGHETHDYAEATGTRCCVYCGGGRFHKIHNRPAVEVVSAVVFPEALTPFVVFDDGSTVAVSSWAGGAAAAGAWSEIRLAFKDAAGGETYRRYVAAPELNEYSVAD